MGSSMSASGGVAEVGFQGGHFAFLTRSGPRLLNGDCCVSGKRRAMPKGGRRSLL